MLERRSPAGKRRATTLAVALFIAFASGASGAVADHCTPYPDCGYNGNRPVITEPHGQVLVPCPPESYRAIEECKAQDWLIAFDPVPRVGPFVVRGTSSRAVSRVELQFFSKVGSSAYGYDHYSDAWRFRVSQDLDCAGGCPVSPTWEFTVDHLPSGVWGIRAVDWDANGVRETPSEIVQIVVAGQPEDCRYPGACHQPSPARAEYNVVVAGNVFTPADIDVFHRQSPRLIYQNLDRVLHSVTDVRCLDGDTGTPCRFDTTLHANSFLQNAGTVSTSVLPVGTHPFVCRYHPEMTGSITVY